MLAIRQSLSEPSWEKPSTIGFAEAIGSPSASLPDKPETFPGAEAGANAVPAEGAAPPRQPATASMQAMATNHAAA
ncbi:hypothetical protein J19TS2_56840 [Cohnella xylanilytica]|nr:hypothetical protein J19TS2_56840 [Cohnella xylanilytica]